LNVFLEFLLLLLSSVFLAGVISKLASFRVMPWGSWTVCSSTLGYDWSCAFAFCKIGFSGVLLKRREGEFLWKDWVEEMMMTIEAADSELGAWQSCSLY
jgi:hypothetical protein